MQPNADGKDPLNRSLDHLLRSLKSAGPFKFFGIFPQIKIFFLLTPSVMVLSLSLLHTHILTLQQIKLISNYRFSLLQALFMHLFNLDNNVLAACICRCRGLYWNKSRRSKNPLDRSASERETHSDIKLRPKSNIFSLLCASTGVGKIDNPQSHLCCEFLYLCCIGAIGLQELYK